MPIDFVVGFGWKITRQQSGCDAVEFELLAGRVKVV